MFFHSWQKIFLHVLNTHEVGMHINPIIDNNINFESKYGSKKLSEPDVFVKLYEYQKNKKFAEDKFMNGLTPELEKLKEKLTKKFEGQWASRISGLRSVLNSDGSIDKFALKTLYALSLGKTTDWKENIKLFFKGKISLFNSKRADLGVIANIVESCKDNNGNHNKTNLRFAQQLAALCDYNRSDIPDVISSCKAENGIVSGGKYELFKILNDIQMSETMPYLSDENGTVTQNAMDFVLKNQEYSSNKFIKQFIKDVLQNAKGENREEILKILTDNLNLFADKKNFIIADFLKDNTEKINYTSVQQVVRLLASGRFANGIRPVTPMLRNNSGVITKESVDEILRLDTKLNYRDIYYHIIPDEGFYDENHNINPKFVDFFNKMKRMGLLHEFSWFDEYNDALKVAKNQKGQIDWEVMDVFYQLNNKLWDNDNTESNRLYNSLWKRAQEIGKDENGNFTKEGLQKIKDFFKLDNQYDEEISLNKLNTILKGKTTNKILEETVNGKNLYEATQMLEVLNTLKSNRKLNQKTLNTPLQEWDSLMMIIPDILPTEANKQEYSELLKLLGNIKDLDYNVKDKMGVSFLEKVIISENHRLLDVMKSSSVELNYYPEIEFALDNIQNPLFKDIVENLDLKFADLENAAKLGSTEAFQKLESQLDSRFMRNRKSELIKLQKLINKSQNKELKAYFKDKYLEEIQGK